MLLLIAALSVWIIRLCGLCKQLCRIIHNICEAVDFLVNLSLIKSFELLHRYLSSQSLIIDLSVLKNLIKRCRTSTLLNLFLNWFFKVSFCSFYMSLTILITGQRLLIVELIKFRNLSATCRFVKNVFPLFYKNEFEFYR